MNQEEMPKDRVVIQVVDKFTQRSNTGLKKYGTTLEDNPAEFLEWLNHLQEEMMDATLYIQKLKNEINEQITGDS